MNHSLCFGLEDQHTQKKEAWLKFRPGADMDFHCQGWEIAQKADIAFYQRVTLGHILIPHDSELQATMTRSHISPVFKKMLGSVCQSSERWTTDVLPFPSISFLSPPSSRLCHALSCFVHAHHLFFASTRPDLGEACLLAVQPNNLNVEASGSMPMPLPFGGLGGR